MRAPSALDEHEDAARQALQRLLGDFPRRQFLIASRQPLEARLPGVRAERLDLAAPDGRSVRAILTGPEGAWRNLPAVLYCHAHGNRYDIGCSELIEGRPALIDPPYAQALARQNMVALCIDLPCFGEQSGETESALAKRHLWQGRTLFGAMLADLVAALDLLEKSDGVDPARIGALGISMGATLAFWLGALDSRIGAVAHLCCFADLATLVASGAHDLHGIYMTVPGLLGRFRTGEIAGLIAPRPQLACMGLQDPLTPEDSVRVALSDVRNAYAGAGDAFETVIVADIGHKETPAMREAVLAFLRKRFA